ncbi:MAG: ABC transporter substrate-binding protein [Chloroflexi bacterium]|nr:ABC transporter substrate-binding protein [Chloroflexota bacterium]
MTRQLHSNSRLLVLLLIASLLLVACVAPAAPAPATGAQPAATEAPAAASGDVSREDTLIFASDTTDLLTLDPGAAYEFSGIQAVGSVYETLVSVEPGTPGVKPLLAESWDIQDSGDLWTVTFKLNSKATFASGKPVTAEDVVYSWSRAIDLNKSPAFLLIDTTQVKKENLKAVDAQTFEVKLPKAVSPQVFLSVITSSVAAVVEKALVEANLGEDMGSTWLNDHSAGSGPYVLTSWEREVAITLDANPTYWGTAPKIKRVIMQNMKEAANRQAAIETGDADIVQDLGPEQKKALEGNADVKTVTASNTQLVYIGMNAQKAPLDNPDVREAIRYAINYDEIITLTQGDAKLVQEIIPDGFLGHTGENPFKQDIAKAKELLAKAGWKDGTEIEALVPSNFPAGPIDFPTLATKVQSDLEKVGIKLTLKQLQVSELLNVFRAQGAQMVFILWGPDYPDPDGNVTPFTNYDAKSIAWRNGWENKEAAALAQQAAVADTDEARVKLYAQVTELVLHQGPYAILYQPLRTYSLRSNLDGFVFDPADTPNITFALISKK